MGELSHHKLRDEHRPRDDDLVPLEYVQRTGRYRPGPEHALWDGGHFDLCVVPLAEENGREQAEFSARVMGRLAGDPATSP